MQNIWHLVVSHARKIENILHSDSLDQNPLDSTVLSANRLFMHHPRTWLPICRAG
jgi:hypothetical protein